MSRTRFLPAGLSFALATLTVAGAAPAAPVEWKVEDGGNGHFYERVYSAAGPTWEEARAAAAARTFGGVGGHLATVTSEAEMRFVHASIARVDEGDRGELAWLGAVQTAGAATPSEGWSWVTGEPWGYTAWISGEPNDWPNNFGAGRELGTEQHVTTLSWMFSAANGAWNDFDGRVSLPYRAYVVEYPVVPEPSSAALLLTLAGMALLRRTPGMRR